MDARRAFAVRCRLALLPIFAVVLIASSAIACPFCNAVKPTLAQCRDSAQIVVLAEVVERSCERKSFQVHQALKGESRLGGAKLLDLPVAAGPSEQLVLLFGGGSPESPLAKLDWTIVAVDETSYAYFAKGPDLRKPGSERLRYFARYLEHANPVIAEDAFLEFGHAPYDQVVEVADLLSMDRLRAWLVDPQVPQERHGFYALALGLTADARERRINSEFLARLIAEPKADFRAGFGGVLAGYLLLTGEPGLEQIEKKYLSNAVATDGDIRHAMSALRFYYEYGREIPRPRLTRALRHLLARNEFAAVTIIDLARWQDWESVNRIAKLYEQKEFSDDAVRRAIVGYLHACPLSTAREQLARLRKMDPHGIEDAEQNLTPSGQLR